MAKKPDPLEDRCRFCGQHLGYGHPIFHLGFCEKPECRKKHEAERKEKGKQGYATGHSS